MRPWSKDKTLCLAILYNRIIRSKITSHWCIPLMFSFDEKVDKRGINRITYQKGRCCQKLWDILLPHFKYNNVLELQEKAGQKHKQSHRWNESTWGWNPIVQIINCCIGGPMFFVSHVMPRDEIKQSYAARKKIYMEDEDSWGLPEVHYWNQCYWPFSVVSVKIMYVSSAERNNLLTCSIQKPETRVCMKDGDTWGLPEVQFCNLCYWPSGVLSVEIMYVSSAE